MQEDALFSLLCLFTGFFAKHIIADYYLQFSWMIKDKGIYNAKGGIAHSGLHALLTYLILILTGFGYFYTLILSLLDYVFHYHIDYVKSNLWKRYNYGPNDQMYWVIHGTVQFLHLMTYVLIIYLLFLPLI